MNQREAQLLKAAAKGEGFPEGNAENYLCVLQGRVYITKGGLEFLMDKQHPEGWAVQAHLPSQAEYDLVRDMMGTDDRLIIMRGEVYIHGQDEPFTDWGTATPQNLKGITANYGLEMAATRAKNRAMRAAVRTGLVSSDELDGTHGTQTPPASRTEAARARSQPRVVVASAKTQREFLARLLWAHKEGVLTDDEYTRGKAVCQQKEVLATTLAAARDRLEARIKAHEKGDEG